MLVLYTYNTYQVCEVIVKKIKEILFLKCVLAMFNKLPFALEVTVYLDQGFSFMFFSW